MVEILGNGVNVEALLGSVGSTISDYANNIVSTLVNTIRQLGNYLYNGMLIFISWIKQFLFIVVQFLKEQFSRYMALAYTDPLKFSLASINMMLLFRGEVGGFINNNPNTHF